jgi:DNA-binding NtrC family response regulator
MPRILVIEDDKTLADYISVVLEEHGFDVALTYNAIEGLDLLKKEKFSLVLTDLIMPCGISGIDVLKEISASKIEVPVIVVTAFASVETAVEAMKLGAFDYVTKPFNIDELVITINRAIEVAKLKKENTILKEELKKKYSFKGLIGISPKMLKVYEIIEKIADTDCTLLITGESGTGKELIAKTIHYNSSRSQRPFVPINCAAIPASLLESELFGYEKGAFTGAFNTRIGRFELANNGTLFLDEIGDLDPSLQAKLLRVIQEKEFERVGGVKTIKVDVRIIAATNQNLEELTKIGRFREDLFYRLNVVQLHVPPLRERREDIPLLLDYYVNEFSKKMKRNPFEFSDDTMECLLNYHWPGNVRELRNLVEGLMILVKGNKVTLSDLPERFLQKSTLSLKKSDQGIEHYLLQDRDEINLENTLYIIERALILRALKKAKGVKSKAAKLLGIKRTTLIEKLKRIEIDPKQIDINNT